MPRYRSREYLIGTAARLVNRGLQMLKEQRDIAWNDFERACGSSDQESITRRLYATWLELDQVVKGIEIVLKKPMIETGYVYLLAKQRQYGHKQQMIRLDEGDDPK